MTGHGNTTARKIFQLLESWAPKSFAFEGDKVGLMLGSYEKSVQKVLITLDVTESVVKEAVSLGVDAIISHHPLLFKPLNEINTNTSQGRVIQSCLTHDLTVYAAHTNLDIAEGGVNDWLADALGLKQTEVLVPTAQDALRKLVAFVPEDNEEKVRNAIGEAGAGHIGEYSHCTFTGDGTGTFLPSADSNPHIGEQGQMTFVAEKRMETIVPASKLTAVLQALTEAHPYEEPAYDLYPLDLAGKAIGLGRVGELTEETTLSQFADHMKKVFQIEALRIVGDPNALIKNVAIVGGAGENYWQQALEKGADIFITGDLKYHAAQDAEAAGLLLADPGHHIEAIMKKELAKRLRQEAEREKLDVEFIASEKDTEPFKFV